MRLEVLQKAMSAAVLGAETAALSTVLRAPIVDPLARLAVHHNNTVLSLTTALAASFPVTEALLGAAYFGQAARRFVMEHPPSEPRLNRYGRSFPHFLARLTDLRKLPFVSRVALLERMILDVLDEPPAESLTLADLAQFKEPAEARLALQPALRLLALRYDAAGIWQAHQGDGELMPAMGRPGRHFIQVVRRGQGVVVTALSVPRYAFRCALRDGHPLGAAARSIDDPTLLASELRSLFSEGLVARELSR
jgi:hypothetical protein